MRKKNKLWSYALAGALAISNLSVVATPLTAYAAVEQDAEAAKDSKAYITKIEAGAGFDTAYTKGTTTLAVSLKASCGYNEDGENLFGILSDTEKKKSAAIPVAYELYKGSEALWHAPIVAKDGDIVNIPSTNEIDFVLGDKTSAAGAKVEELAGKYSIVLYYGDNTGVKAEAGSISDTSKMTQIGTKNEFSIYKVTEKYTTEGTKAKLKVDSNVFYVLEGDAHMLSDGDPDKDGTLSATGFTSDADSNTSNSGTKVNISGDTVFTEVETFNAKDLTYHLGFDSDDGGAVEDTVVKSVGALTDVTIPDLSSLNGMNGLIFEGWSTSVDGSVNYKPGDNYVVSLDASKNDLYAVWKEGYVAAYYDGTDAIVADDLLIVYKNGSVKLPESIKKVPNGKVLSGWNEGTSASNRAAATDLELGATVNYEKAVHQKLAAAFVSTGLDSTTVWFDATSVKTKNAAKMDPATIYKNYHPVLIAATVISFTNSANGKAAYLVNSDYTSKKWDANYDEFSAGKAKEIKSTGVNVYTSGDADELTQAQINELTQTVAQNETVALKKNVFTSPRFDFVGWATESDLAKGKITFEDGGKITLGDIASADFSSTGNLTLYAVWTPKEEYDVDIYDNRTGSGSQFNNTAARVHFYEGVEGDLPKVTWAWSGYTLKGYAESASATDAKYTLGQKGLKFTSDTDLFCVWEANGGNTSEDAKQEGKTTPEQEKAIADAVATANTAADAAVKSPSDANIKALQDSINAAVAAGASTSDVKALSDKLATALTTAKKNAETNATNQKAAADKATQEKTAAENKANELQKKVDAQFVTAKKAKATNGYVVNTFANGQATLVSIPAAKTKATMTLASKVTVNGKTYKVTAIAAKALKSNTKIKTLTVPATVKQIGANAFGSKVTKLTVKGSNVQVLNNALKSINKNAKVVAKNAYTLTQLKTFGNAKKTVKFGKK